MVNFFWEDQKVVVVIQNSSLNKTKHYINLIDANHLSH